MNIKFFIPGYYSMMTRIIKKTTKISYVYNFFIPVLVLSYLVGMKLEKMSFLSLIIAFYMLNIVYEIGYIYNDVYTVNFEKEPTIRLNNKDFQELRKLYPIMLATRIQIIIVLLFLLNNIFFIKEMNLYMYIFSLGMLNLVYSFHNYYRGPQNILTMLCLMILKYLTVPLLFVEKNTIFLFIFLLTIPILRTVLYTSHERAKIKIKLLNKKEIKLGIRKEKVTLFRIKYYLMIILFGIMIMILDKKIGSILIAFSSYFFIFYLGAEVFFKIIKNVKSKIVLNIKKGKIYEK